MAQPSTTESSSQWRLSHAANGASDRVVALAAKLDWFEQSSDVNKEVLAGCQQLGALTR
jgi:hypothetical protein